MSKNDVVPSSMGGRPLRVYISGPIAGHPDGNRSIFFKYEQAITAAGHTAVNPHNVSHEHDGPCMGAEVPRSLGEEPAEHRYGCYMRADLVALLECDAIVMLPGWGLSKGAKVEYDVAKILGIEQLWGDPDSVVQQLIMVAADRPPLRARRGHTVQCHPECAADHVAARPL